ncbi:hypothetical protein F4677DRAFT_439010 [Hypoxylon crocopeplum]|nr:hypothetical protein F4677DRAFT_439010 [Hypoxylon crocopeplum]
MLLGNEQPDYLSLFLHARTEPLRPTWLDDQDWVAKHGFFGASTYVVDDIVNPAAWMVDANGAWTGPGKWLDW